ncbi:Outer membrane protein assembly factor BamD [Thalassocella blandensis]|nr:Outer membrane protein assembly factor BamD [Thalassocella blandensis]
MMKTNNLLRYSLLLSCVFLHACMGNKKEEKATLADIDFVGGRYQSQKENISEEQDSLDKKSREDIRSAYYRYIETASDKDISRKNALNRLAELELEITNRMIRESSDDDQDSPAYTAALAKTINLLETTLRDYPEAKENDRVMYQLAQAYDRSGRYNDAIALLETLVQKYPRSTYYPEAQFRIAESAFAHTDYFKAEDAYTEVILTPGNDKFYEKSLFKRGWTRYKGQFYEEATDDFVEAIKYHRFGNYTELTDADKTHFDEYFRALGLAFSYQKEDGAIRDYFENVDDYKYLYETYAAVSDVYLKQERYSDAAQILEQFAQYHKDSPKLPQSELKKIEAWKAGGFTNRLFNEIEGLYTHYNPESQFWKAHQDEYTAKEVNKQLRQYIVQITSYYHERYQNKRKNEDFSQAQTWYERYLKHYGAYGNQDNIYALYGELLVSAGQNNKAINYYEQAAFDGNIILDKKAAYSAISLSNDLVRKSNNANEKKLWLDKHIRYAQRYVELYPEDTRVESIALNAAELGFSEKAYQQAIEIADFIPDNAKEKTRFAANNIKARSYLELAQYTDAEAVYLELLDSGQKTRNDTKTIIDSLALSIYRQGEAAQKDNNIDMALNHFTRISSVTPESELAATGLYDAIALTMEHKRWEQAIGLINSFKQRFPRHKLVADVTKKLSVAYLSSDQKGKAAEEFERISQFEENQEVKMAALWQAAQLYESKKNREGAIRAYRDFAHTYSKPYAQNIEAMYKLTELYGDSGDNEKRHFWQNKIRQADKKATKREKTERTQFIASTTILELAQQRRQDFSSVKLVEPLAQNLKRKKSAMQDSVKLYGQASAYGVAEITTEATYSIGKIYQDFSRSLLDSERPKTLSADELEQYEILLEDQAFPFEEKAIEFYETNLARTKDGTFDNWLNDSFKELQGLFPVRYKRTGKISAY